MATSPTQSETKKNHRFAFLAFLFWTWTVSTCFNSFQCCSDAARRCFSSNWASSQASQWLWSHVKSKVSLTLPAEYVTLNISEHLTLKSLTISAKTFPTTHSASFLNLLKPQMNNVFGIQTCQRPMTKHYKKHDKNCKHCKHCTHWRSFWLVLTRTSCIREGLRSWFATCSSVCSTRRTRYQRVSSCLKSSQVRAWQISSAATCSY